MLACSVPRDRIRDWGYRLSITGVDPYLKGRTFIKPTSADVVFFGWMSPHTAVTHSIKVTKPDEAISIKIALLLRGSDNINVDAHGVAPAAPYLSSASAVAISLLLQSQCSDVASPVLQQHQLAAVLFGFMFALRADTIVHINIVDICFTSSELIFTETTRKSKNKAVSREVHLPLEHSFAPILKSYLSWIVHLTPDSHASLFGFSPSTRSKSSSLMNGCLKVALAVSEQHYSHVSSHMLRRGAAIAMLAFSVAKERIRDWGHWLSVTGIDPYLKGRTFIRPTHSDLVCFGWMSPHTLALGSAYPPGSIATVLAESL